MDEPEPPKPPGIDKVQPDVFAEEFIQMAQAFGAAVEPVVREQYHAEVEKERIRAGSHEVTLKAQLAYIERAAAYSLTRFRWLIIVATIFGVLLFGLSAVLVLRGETFAGLMIISHVVTLIVGLIGGRGLKKEETQHVSPPQPDRAD